VKKLKILYHHRVAAQDGQSVHINSIIDAFRSLGHDVYIVGPSIQPKKLGQQNRGLKLIRRLIPAFLYEVLEIIYGQLTKRKLKKAYEKFKPDILYERYNLYTPAGKWLKKQTGIPYLLEVNAPLADERSQHGKLVFENYARLVEEQTWKAADYLLPVSKVLGDIIQHSISPQKNIISVLHNGINLQTYENLPDKKQAREQLSGFTIPTDAICLGFVGFARKWHGLETIIKLIAEETQKQPSIKLHFLIIGDGPAIESCMECAKSLNLSDQVHFTGFIEQAKIPAYLSSIDIALQPSVTEYASPLKLFEYMAASLAIIAPNQNNIQEVLKDGSNALLFNIGDQGMLMEHIRALIHNPQLRSELGQAAYQTIIDNKHTWLDNARTIIKLANTSIKPNIHR
jgi:glycosyltransferase involved in cell wall biosynthesis